MESQSELKDCHKKCADKALTRLTSLSRRMESIVPLERGACSCAELQGSSCLDAKWKNVRRCALFQQHGDARCHHFFFLQGKVSKEIHATLKETLRELAPPYATNKNCVSHFNVVIYPLVLRLVLDDTKQ